MATISLPNLRTGASGDEEPLEEEEGIKGVGTGDTMVRSRPQTSGTPLGLPYRNLHVHGIRTTNDAHFTTIGVHSFFGRVSAFSSFPWPSYESRKPHCCQFGT